MQKSANLTIKGNYEVIGKSKRDRIIAGYASIAEIDIENQLITTQALEEGIKTLLDNEYFSNLNLSHNNIQIGIILKEYKNLKTHVDDKGLFIVAQIRCDLKVADEVWEKILNGELRAFSIAGEIIDYHDQCDVDSESCFEVIDKLNIFEISVCGEPVNVKSGFTVISKNVCINKSEKMDNINKGQDWKLNKAALSWGKSKINSGNYSEDDWDGSKAKKSIPDDNIKAYASKRFLAHASKGDPEVKSYWGYPFAINDTVYIKGIRAIISSASGARGAEGKPEIAKAGQELLELYKSKIEKNVCKKKCNNIDDIMTNEEEKTESSDMKESENDTKKSEDETQEKSDEVQTDDTETKSKKDEEEVEEEEDKDEDDDEDDEEDEEDKKKSSDNDMGDFIRRLEAIEEVINQTFSETKEKEANDSSEDTKVAALNEAIALISDSIDIKVEDVEKALDALKSKDDNVEKKQDDEVKTEEKTEEKTEDETQEVDEKEFKLAIKSRDNAINGYKEKIEKLEKEVNELKNSEQESKTKVESKKELSVPGSDYVVEKGGIIYKDE